MILVDSSVWIDYFRSADTPQTALLDSLLGQLPLAVGDLIVTEVLQGVRDERQFRLVQDMLGSLHHIDIVGHQVAIRAAENYRYLRSLGITVRKTIDTLIATRCIEDDLTLLHADRDFQPYERHLGLMSACSEN